MSTLSLIDEQKLRERCIDSAIRSPSGGYGCAPDQVVARAQAYFDFITGTKVTPADVTPGTMRNRRMAYEKASRDYGWVSTTGLRGPATPDEVMDFAVALLAHLPKCPSEAYWETVVEFGFGNNAAAVIELGERVARVLHAPVAETNSRPLSPDQQGR